MRTTMTVAAVAAMILSASVALAGQTAEQKCEAGKNDAAGKYDACAAKAEKGLVSTGDMERYANALVKCEEKLAARWDKLETAAVDASTVCPSTGDQMAIQNFVDACVQSVALAVGGGTLGPDPVTCSADLSTCTGSLGTCTSNLGTCNSSLGACSGSLTTCNGSLGTCTSSLTAATSSLTTCTGDLSTCNGNYASCSSSLGTCNAALSACQSDLGTANAGTAGLGDVLLGKTFTSNAGLGATGAMPNNGAQVLTPTTHDQAIAAGYHDGGGGVVGDPDLVAGNIKSGVDLFHVVGTLPASALSKTGQTTSYGAGSDGNLQRGAARSFTDNGDGTITDNATGLMWEKKSDDGTIHDKDNTYTWSAFAINMDGTMVTVFLAGLNAGGGFAGYTDWRIPNLTELQSTINLQNVDLAVFAEFNQSCTAGCTVTTCSCTQSGYYLTSTTWRDNPYNHWEIYTRYGNPANGQKTTAYPVRAVRGGF